MKNTKNTLDMPTGLALIITLISILMFVSISGNAQTSFHTFVKSNGGDFTMNGNIIALKSYNKANSTSYNTFWELYMTTQVKSKVKAKTAINENISINIIEIKSLSNNNEIKVNNIDKVQIISLKQKAYRNWKNIFITFKVGKFHNAINNSPLGLSKENENDLVWVTKNVYYLPQDCDDNIYNNLQSNRKVLKQEYLKLIEENKNKYAKIVNSQNK